MAISVLIPVLNEEKTIGTIVHDARKNPLVDEVIVVDDKSQDATVMEAKNAGASVITSTKIGKGASMRDGILIAKNDIVIFLDGDVDKYPANTIASLSQPLLADQADFVKGTFQREAGRVTELVAKPLISLLFPELKAFSQPLSGMIAGKKAFFNKVAFEDDYGIDIGILIDMHHLGARIVEVNIGEIKHKMKQWQELSRMSREVSRAILKRATAKSIASLDSLETITIIRDQMEYSIKETLLKLKKMVVFDMDKTILMGRFIEKAAQTFGFQNELIEIISTNQESYLLTKLIARLLKGKNFSELLSVTDAMPLVPDTAEIVSELKKRGYIIGIISDSYDCIANHIKIKIGADFALANEIEFSQSIATGEVKIPSFFMRTERSRCKHDFCKSNAMFLVAEKYNTPLANVIAVGDSENDICMLKFSGVGVSFCSENNILNMIADRRIEEKTFRPILEFAK